MSLSRKRQIGSTMLTLFLLAVPYLLIFGIGAGIYCFHILRGSRRYL